MEDREAAVADAVAAAASLICIHRVPREVCGACEMQAKATEQKSLLEKLQEGQLSQLEKLAAAFEALQKEHASLELEALRLMEVTKMLHQQVQREE